MKFDDFLGVANLVADLNALRKDYANLNAGGVLGVTFNGTYQKEPVLDFVRPTIATYMEEQYALKVTALQALGVTDIPPID